ncbi:galactosylceramide sulfotransferase-like [Saccostrea echinata]|uniref:galactosylceramide sulfotransferase-like n=1 Tax=Saccostrea echinata TaxID=191078 RepID=UPI002A7EB92B|nr:galactosylceramide sulfotransferase-like [Saccostrea echinata]
MAHFRIRYWKNKRLLCLILPLILVFLTTDIFFSRTATLLTGETNLNTIARHHIAYIKVHKAASSTIQNILLRYGYMRNLTFVLGRNANVYPNVISITESVTKYNIEPPPKNKTFDISCSHVIYNRQSFSAIMPRDTVYLASVREPFTVFISTLHYFRPPYIFNINVSDPISMYLKNPEKYEPEVKNSLTNNRMAFELGFPLQLFHSKNWAGIKEYLKKLDKEMDLILVVERLEESIVLLRRLLHWKLQDILYVPKNKFEALDKKTKSKLNEKFYLRKDAKRKFEKWAVLDYILYKFAVKKLERQIRSQNTDFQNEVAYFKFIRMKVEEFCLKQSKPYRNVTFTVYQSVWNDKFVVDSLMCSQMILRESYFIKEIRYQQYGVLPSEDN